MRYNHSASHGHNMLEYHVVEVVKTVFCSFCVLVDKICFCFSYLPEIVHTDHFHLHFQSGLAGWRTYSVSYEGIVFK